MKPANIALALNAIPPPSLRERSFHFPPQHHDTSTAASLRRHGTSSYSPSTVSHLSKDDPVNDVPACIASSAYDPSTLHDVSSLLDARNGTVVITPSVEIREGTEALIQDLYTSPEGSIDSTQSFYDSVPYQPPKQGEVSDFHVAPPAVVESVVSSPAPSVASGDNDLISETASYLHSEIHDVSQPRDTVIPTGSDTGTGRNLAFPATLSMSPLDRLQERLNRIDPKRDGTIGTDTSILSTTPSVTSFRDQPPSTTVTASEVTLEPVDQVHSQPEPYQSTPGRGSQFKKWIQSYAPSAASQYDKAKSHANQWGSQVADTASAWRSEAASALPDWVPKVSPTTWTFSPTTWTFQLPSRSAMSKAATSTAGDLKSRFNSGCSRAKSGLDSGVSNFQSDVQGYTDTLRSKLPSLSRWGRSRRPGTGTSAVSVPAPSFATSAPRSATMTAQSTRSPHAPVRSYFSHAPAIGLRNRWNSRASRGAKSDRTTLPSVDTVNRGSQSFISKLGDALSDAWSDYQAISGINQLVRTF